MLSQFILFTAVGAVGTFVHFAILITSVHVFGSSPVQSSIVGFVFGALVNYGLNYNFTFQSQNRHSKTLFRFFVVAFCGLGLNAVVMMIATKWIHYLISQAIATCCVLIWNFVCNRSWTFKEVSYDRS